MLGLSPLQVLILDMLAIVLFRKQLGTVALSLGKVISDFKKGM